MSVTDYINVFAFNDVESHILPTAGDVGSTRDTDLAREPISRAAPRGIAFTRCRNLPKSWWARLCANARPDYVVDALLATVLIADDETRLSKIMIAKWNHPMKKNGIS